MDTYKIIHSSLWSIWVLIALKKLKLQQPDLRGSVYFPCDHVWFKCSNIKILVCKKQFIWNYLSPSPTMVDSWSHWPWSGISWAIGLATKCSKNDASASSPTVHKFLSFKKKPRSLTHTPNWNLLMHSPSCHGGHDLVIPRGAWSRHPTSPVQHLLPRGEASEQGMPGFTTPNSTC